MRHLETALALVAICCGAGTLVTAEVEKDDVIILTSQNWTECLKGEWLIEFYAPWCPACQQHAPIWSRLATNAPANYKIAKINVQDNPDLNGKFLIFSMPTIYHVRNGVFRWYDMSRNYEELFKFITSPTAYREFEPTPSWYAPDSYIMVFVGHFFNFSAKVQRVQGYLSKEWDLPYWVIYTILVLGTVVSGLLLGVMIVVICDRFFPNMNANHKSYIDDSDDATADALSSKSCSSEDEGVIDRGGSGGQFVRKRAKKVKKED